MKKLMIAIGAAMSLALGAWAEESFTPTGTGFEALDAGSVLNVNLDDSGLQNGPFCWTSDNTTDGAESVITEDTENRFNKGEGVANKFLAVEESATLYRWMKDRNDNEYTSIEGQSVYFSSKVEFTASEEEGMVSSVSEGDKILIWLRGTEPTTTENEDGTTTEDPGATNLVITAGKWNPEKEAYEAYDYVCDTEVVAGEVYNMVVTASIGTDESRTVTEFSVKLGETVVEATVDGVKKTAFPSIVQIGDAAKTIACVGFKGTGKIDDLEFGTVQDVAQTCTVTIRYNGNNIGGVGLGTVANEYEGEDTFTELTYEGVNLGPTNLVLTLKSTGTGLVYDGTTYTEEEFSISLDLSSVTPGGVFYVDLSDGEAAHKLLSIAVTTAPTKTAYTAGEAFDPAGMVVTATYSDETTAVVTGYTCSPNGALTTDNNTITISFTEGDTTVETTVTITVTASGNTWPKTWNDNVMPASMATTFNTWIANNNATAANAEAAFLLGYDVADYEDLKATIEIDADGNIVISGSKGLHTVNGVVRIKAATTPGAVDAATPEVVTVDSATGKATIRKGDAPAQFFKVVVGYPAN